MIAIHSALALPRLHRVRTGYTFRRQAHAPKVARLAKILLELGHLSNRDAPRGPAEGAMVESALGRFTDRALGRRLTVIRDVYVNVAPDAVEEYADACEYTGTEPEEPIEAEDSVIVALAPWDEGDAYLLEARCTRIEALAPGLAQTALGLLDYGCGRSVPTWRPSVALEWAEAMYGWGEEAEEESAREEDLGLRFKDFAAAIPEWVYRPQRTLARPKLEAIARRGRGDARRLASAALELMDALADKRALPPSTINQWRTSFGAMLRWSPHDCLPAICDDYVQDAQNGGEATSDYSIHCVRLDARSVAHFLDGLARMLKTLACVDRVIGLIAEPA